MGNVLDCSADPLEGELDLSTLDGPIMKPFHAMSIRELAYNVKYDAQEDAKRYRGNKGKSGQSSDVEEESYSTSSLEKDEGEQTSASLSVLEPPPTQHEWSNIHINMYNIII